MLSIALRGALAAAFVVAAFAAAGATRMEARADAAGQVLVTENGRPVLRYNYRAIAPPPGFVDAIAAGNRIYAVARSDYLHPIYGPDGEALTKDWSPDHPHHRGIYWAWPEVDYGDQRGDLHALQRVFARPTGKITLHGGARLAEIVAESDWLWEDREPIVRETATIRAYPWRPTGRAIDLVLRFEALKDGVTLARRGTEHYGGLNVRLAAIQDQDIVWHTDPAGARPRMAWEDVRGTFPGGKAPLGFAVLQHAGNPEYPGDWVKFPELNWSQPTFPTARTRYPLKPGLPLVLRYRIWVHPAGLDDAAYAREWQAFNAATR